MRAAIVIPAAGSGRRLGLDVPKALVDVCGRPLVCRTLERFEAVEPIVEAVVAVPASERGRFTEALADLRFGGAPPTVVVGGATRQESVRIGVDSLGERVDVVAVHDAARPLVTKGAILAVLEAGARGAATLVSRPADSVRQVSKAGASTAIDRASLRLVGTPQAFRPELLVDAHRTAVERGVEATDDASIIESCTNAHVELVERDELNLKVTHPEDLELVRLIVADRLRRG